MRLQLQPAYVLHRRAYRDSSELLELLTAEHGRLGAVARGLTRRRPGGALGALLQPFRPILVSLSGRGDLLTLTAVEAGGDLPALSGDALLCGFYVNELLLRALQRFEGHPQVFLAYGHALESLAAAGDGRSQALVLRTFEFALLDDLGYAIDFAVASDTGAPVEAGGLYHLLPGEGVICADGSDSRRDAAVPGADLLAIAARDLASVDAGVLKRIARGLLAAHLGSEPFRTQDVFRSLRASGATP